MSVDLLNLETLLILLTLVTRKAIAMTDHLLQ